MMWRHDWLICLLGAAALLVPRPGLAQDAATAQDSFVVAAREASLAFADRRDAIRQGYRKVGPDFPGMGEHWVHPSLLVSGRLDPAHPPVLSYVDLNGEPVLVGLAFALPLRPGESPPDGPLSPDLWHDHSGDVDEETLLLNSSSSMAHPDREEPRLSMVHVWTGVPNPAGLFAQNNWTLPFVRAGVPVPDSIHVQAARGISLSGDGATFYAALVRRAVPLEPHEEKAITSLLAQHAARVDSLVEAESRQPTPTFQGRLADEWTRLWRGVHEVVGNDRWHGLEGFVTPSAAAHRGH